jgi:hypothetical protein
MSRFASNASDHGQPPQGPNANRNQDENPHPVGDQLAFAFAEEGAVRKCRFSLFKLPEHGGLSGGFARDAPLPLVFASTAPT